MNNKSLESSRSWFCVLNNPQNVLGELTPDEMVNKVIEMWCDDKPQRSCGVNYEIGDSGTPHMHMVLEDPSKTRFAYVQRMFKGIHIETTRGTKEQALDYINKRGSFEEKGHTVVVPPVFHGEIKANKGMRKDLDVLQELIDQGMTPDEIMDIHISNRKYETFVRKAYFRKRLLETPPVRDIVVFWHVGDSGSGKSYSYKKICEEVGREKIYLLSDYDGGGFDMYCGEKILFLDEFKGNLKYQVLLNVLDKYPVQLHSRYNNVFALWTEVHITSIYPPEEAYKFMVETDNQKRDSIEQLKRRISAVIYHYVENGEYKSLNVPMSEYVNYENLKAKVHPSTFEPYSDVPFDLPVRER